MLASIFELDRQIFMAIFGGTTPGPFLYVMYALTVIGRGYILWAVATLALLPRSATRVLPPTLFTLERQRLARELLVVLVIAAVSVYVGKWIVQRPRPYVQFHLIPLGGSPPRDYSFPSGHAAGAFAFALFFVSRLPTRRLGTVALVLFAVSISISRIYLGAHFPTDILAGSVLGGLIGGVGGRAFRLRALRDGAAEGAELASTGPMGHNSGS